MPDDAKNRIASDQKLIILNEHKTFKFLGIDSMPPTELLANLRFSGSELYRAIVLVAQNELHRFGAKSTLIIKEQNSLI